MRVGRWVCLVFEKCRYPSPGGGGVSSFRSVGGRCPWAETPCDTWGCCHFAQTCFALQSSHGYKRMCMCHDDLSAIPEHRMHQKHHTVLQAKRRQGEGCLWATLAADQAL